MISDDGHLEWFAGDQQALDLFRMFVDVAHIWDDLIDKDKEVSDEKINYAFTLALVSIPGNPVFQAHYRNLNPLLVTSIMGYRLANQYEKDKDEHGIEIAHSMRYAIAQVFMYLITVYNGHDKAMEILPQAMKEMICERFEDYRNEQNAKA